MRMKQAGVAALLLVFLLLVASLTMTLVSYKNVFFQAKRAQNELQHRQQQWLAEGGLECAFAKVYYDRDGKLLSQAGYLDDDCLTPLTPLQFNVQTIAALQYQIDSLASHNHLTKVIDQSGRLSTGAIKTTANLLTHGATVFSPPDPGKEQEDGWECVGVRYKYDLDFTGGISNQGLDDYTLSPSGSFDANGKTCLASHSSQNSVHLAQDVQQDSELDPFYEVFETDSSEWQSIRDDPVFDFSVIHGDVVIAGSYAKQVSNCGSKIANQINSGKRRIWLEGSCDLTGQGLLDMTSASNVTDGVLLMLHNGILSIVGSGTFKGVLFQFNQGFVASDLDWQGFSSHVQITASANLYNNKLKNIYGTPVPSITQAAYFQRGSFDFTGGQILDMDNQIAIVDDALKFSYNSDVINSVLGFAKPRWMQGSWQSGD